MVVVDILLYFYYYRLLLEYFEISIAWDYLLLFIVLQVRPIQIKSDSLYE